MKKWNFVFLLWILMVVLPSCGVKPTEPTLPTTNLTVVVEAEKEAPERVVTLHIYQNTQFAEQKTEEGILLYQSHRNVLHLTDKEGELYPHLAASLEALNQALQKEEEAAQAIDTEYAWEAFTSREDPEFFPYFFFNIDTTLQRADSRVCSVLIDSSEFSGGLHPNSWYEGKNYDTETGAALQLGDVITDVSLLPELISQLVMAKYPDCTFFDLAETIQSEVEENTLSWIIGYNGLTVYFSPYEIASYADGFLSAELPFVEYPELFAEKYSTIPESYVLPFATHLRSMKICRKDGEPLELRYETEWDENGIYQDELTLYAGEQMLQDELGAIDLDVYFVHQDATHEYFYVDADMANSYGMLHVYEISSQGIVPVATMPATSIRASGYVGYRGMNVFSDPNLFELGTQMQILSTMAGSRSYHVGANGMPEANEEYYTMTINGNTDTEATLTAKCPVKVTLLDMDSLADTGKIQEMPVGTVFHFWRTDGKKLVDMITDEGILCRMKVEGVPSWQQKVNGMEIEKCFEGIRFAG